MPREIGSSSEIKAANQDNKMISAFFDRTAFQSFGFWALGILSVSTAFSFGLYDYLPLGTQSMVGLDFIVKQSSLLGLQVGFSLAFGKILSGVLLGHHWIPRISHKAHAAFRTVFFVITSSVMMMFLVTFYAFGTFVIHTDYLKYPPLAYAFIICILLWGLTLFRPKRRTSIWYFNGWAVTLVALSIWLSFALGQARIQRIISHEITICLTGNRTLIAAPITVNNNMLVWYQMGATVFDGFQIGTWGAVPTDEIIVTLEQVDVGQRATPLGCDGVLTENSNLQIQSE